MAVATAERSSWGGFLEAAIIGHIIRVKVYMFEHNIHRMKLLSIAGDMAGEHVFVAWQGHHWVVANVQGAALASLVAKD